MPTEPRSTSRPARPRTCNSEPIQDTSVLAPYLAAAGGTVLRALSPTRGPRPRGRRGPCDQRGGRSRSQAYSAESSAPARLACSASAKRSAAATPRRPPPRCGALRPARASSPGQQRHGPAGPSRRPAHDAGGRCPPSSGRWSVRPLPACAPGRVAPPAQRAAPARLMAPNGLLTSLVRAPPSQPGADAEQRVGHLRQQWLPARPHRVGSSHHQAHAAFARAHRPAGHPGIGWCEAQRRQLPSATDVSRCDGRAQHHGAAAPAAPPLNAEQHVARLRGVDHHHDDQLASGGRRR